MKLRFALAAIIILMLAAGTGCSVYMAAKQPDKKDVSVFNKGTPRAHVIAECGKPVHTLENKDGTKTDIFVFVQGYSGGAKAGRAFFHGAADILTLGLWEVVGTPIEAVADGTEVKVEVAYDVDERVSQVNALTGEDKLAEVDSLKDDSGSKPEILPEMTGETTIASASPLQVNPDEAWSGMWKVESTGPFGRGTWGLEQRGRKVVATKDSSFGNIVGNIKGKQLKGRVIQSHVDYRFTIKMSPDYRSFEGTLVGFGNKTEWLKGTRKNVP